MKKIDFILSDKLYDKLLKIKDNLSISENCNVELNDMIEESLMFYYNITILDLNEITFDEKIINKINYINNIKNDYYVYVYSNTNKRIDRYINNFYFEYEPFYIGKGNGNRMYDFNNRDENLINQMKELKENNSLKIEKIIFDLTEDDAYFYEQIFINNFGRLNNGTGILYNKVKGNRKNKKEIDKNNLKLNLQYNFIEKLLIELNNEKTLKKVSIKLNISERTLFRKIKEYSLVKDKTTKSWYIDEKK